MERKINEEPIHFFFHLLNKYYWMLLAEDYVFTKNTHFVFLLRHSPGSPGVVGTSMELSSGQWDMSGSDVYHVQPGP